MKQEERHNWGLIVGFNNLATIVETSRDGAVALREQLKHLLVVM